ncbi:dienelactone hydrolase [Arthrobacter sp. W1]|nr:dienelactone hydrolase [Arthrobacter sp. W1]
MSTPYSIPYNDSELSALWDRAENAKAVVVLAHGSGAGKDHEFMAGYAQAVATRGISVLRFNFPYMDAGKKFPDKAPVAIAAWNAARQWAADHLAGGLPVFAAGKSFGGRMASMAVAEGMQAAGLIFLGYPLHAPKKGDKLRDGHLYGLHCPLLFLEGTRDPFANQQLMQQVVTKLGPTAQVQWFDGGNHSFKVARSGRSVAGDGASLTEATANFIFQHC